MRKMRQALSWPILRRLASAVSRRRNSAG